MCLPIDIATPVLAVIDDLESRLGQSENIDETIHRIRVDIKKIRAWIRLVRNRSGKKRWRDIDHDLRDFSKLLSAERDQKVMAETLEWLERKTVKTRNHTAIRKISRSVTPAIGRQVIMPAWQDAGILPLLDSLKLEIVSIRSKTLIRKGLKKTFKRASVAGEKAFTTHGSIDDLHQFRKWVKYLYYQTGFIQGLHVTHFSKLHRQLGRLEKRLGRIHDLAVVKRKLGELATAAEWKKPAAITNGLIDKYIEDYINKTGRSYRKIFSQTPANFTGATEWRF